jgi:hypothetical protein
MIELFDDILIDRLYQPVVDFFSKWLGVSKYRLSYACLYLTFIPGVTDIKYHHHLDLVIQCPEMIPLAVCLTVLGFMMRDWIRPDIGKRDAMPSYRLLKRSTRMMNMLFLSIFSSPPQHFGYIDHIWNLIGLSLLVSFYFFPACNDGPPRKKLFENVTFSFMQLQPAGA